MSLFIINNVCATAKADWMLPVRGSTTCCQLAIEQNESLPSCEVRWWQLGASKAARLEEEVHQILPAGGV